MEPISDVASVWSSCWGNSKSPAGEGKQRRSHSRTPSSLTRWWNSNPQENDAEIEEIFETDAVLGEQDRVLAQLADDLLGLDVSGPSASPAKVAPQQESATSHERKLSWAFSVARKIAPQLEMASASDKLKQNSETGSLTTSTDEAIGSPGAALGANEAADNLVTEDLGAKPQGYRRLWHSITSVRKGDKLQTSDMALQPREYTVESLVRSVLTLKSSQGIMEAPRLASGLSVLDSRAVAALLKDLAKAGAPHRAWELFDYLRAVPSDNELSALADLYTYTTIISQCGGHQYLRRALELVAEMRARGIQCNVHTYSALMSVCVKCNECELALDVYEQLVAEGCAPNLVTYNIMIDAYARTGQWARAVEVLDSIARQGLIPEARTYNSIISACGKASQPAAAAQVYERMLVDGVEPTSTTYTSVISAFGRVGKVDEAFRVYRDMAARGCEANVITYSSLISVCERAGRVELALKLFDEMRESGVRPNVVTYNAIVSACAHAGMWQRAAELVDSMGSFGCRPDGLTFATLATAYERGGQWKQALITMERAQGGGLRPDAGVYNAVLGALWDSGRLPALRKASQLLLAAQRQGALRAQSVSAGDASVPVYTHGAVVLVVLRWLGTFREGLSAAAAFSASPTLRSLTLMRSKHAPPTHSFEPIQKSLITMFTAFSVPATASVTPQGLMIGADIQLLPSWAASASGLALLSLLDFAASGVSQTGSVMIKEDKAVDVQCAKAFAAVREFEEKYAIVGVDPDLLSAPMASMLRQDIIVCLTALSSGLQLQEEAPHDAVQLCDRLLSLAPPEQQPPPPACAAALLLLACRQTGSPAAVLRHGQMVLQAAGLPISAVLEAEQRILSVLGPEPAAISPLRVLHLFLERLGCDAGSLQRCQLAHLMVLTATDLVAKAALSPAFAQLSPSATAAACLMKARESLGLVPLWPTVLQELTKYEAEQMPPEVKHCVDLLHILGLSS